MWTDMPAPGCRLVGEQGGVAVVWLLLVPSPRPGGWPAPSGCPEKADLALLAWRW